MNKIHCINCSQLYPEEGLPYRCPSCSGIFDFREIWHFDPKKVEPDLPGMWRYRHTFGLPTGTQPISLGEGNTPLVWSQISGKQVAFKLEYLNPTGSFKDRGTANLISFMVSRQVNWAVEDSSGNAGASFAAYSARSGIRACVYVPDTASGPKRSQIEAYGAELISVPGPRTNASFAVIEAADKGAVYASHVYMPHGLPGFATIAYEIFDQIGAAPGSVIAPVGHGSLILGVGRGFASLESSGMITACPILIGVQALACAPLWSRSYYGSSGSEKITEGHTIAEGIRILSPIRGDAVIEIVLNSKGKFIAVEEDEIVPGLIQLARRGFFVEPTSATVWPALANIIDDLPEPIVVILTGSGFKAELDFLRV